MQFLCNYLSALLASPLGETERGTGKPKHCSVISGIATTLTNLVPRQAVRIMKLTAIILLVACLQVQATGYGQKVTLALKDAPLEKLFAEIKKQTGYRFLYINKLVQNAQKITIQVKDASVEDVLEQCLREQPFGYEIKEKTIVITPKSSSPGTIQQELTLPNPIEVRGIITDENAAPALGVNVVVKGTNNGTTTNLKGEFTLKNVDENAVLLITSVGYNRQEIPVKNKEFISLQLKVAVGNLDELQVIAYGNTSKRLSTGNISSVKAADIENQPVNNPLLALQGRIPGLYITQSTGLPGTGVTVRIQGQNSITKGNDPLFVIDGVPYTSQLLPTLFNTLGGSGGPVLNGIASGYGNPLSFVNPADIESIELLKDADATAIYGSRAANGAILITTKKGKAGQLKVDINIQNGWGKVTRKLDLLNTRQYLDMRYEALKNDAIMTIPSSAYDLTLWDTTRFTDWQKILIGGTAHYTDAQATVSGGNVTTQYLISGGYHRETTVFPGDFSDQKSSLHFTISSTSTNQKFRLQLSGNYLADNNQLPQTDLTQSAIRLSPNAPAIYNADGNLNWMLNSTASSTWTNPLSYNYNTYQIKTNNLISNAILSYQVLPGLDIRNSLGYTKLQSNETIINPLLAWSPELRPFVPRIGIYGNNHISSWIIEPQIIYKRAIGKGKLETLVGTTTQQSNSNGQQLVGIGYNSDIVIEDIKSAATLRATSNIASIRKYNAVFGRLNYNWQDKYIINLTARRDGSSRFGSANQFHNFGAVGIGWIFSKESFIQKSMPYISFGKLRGSYGTTGNDQIGDYQFLNLYGPPSGVSVTYQGTTSLLPNGLPNQYLQWEETKKSQFGLDLGLFKDKILLTANYFHNRSSNQLLPYALPIMTGFFSITTNFPATVQNTGWEFSLNTTNLKTENVIWSTNINITVAKNKLIDFPNIATSSYSNLLVIGQPITIVKTFDFLGVDPATGKYQFADGTGGITFRPDTSSISRLALINTSPVFYGGFQNSFHYKRFELDIFCQFAKQTGLNYFFGNRPGNFFGGNQPTTILNRWRKPGDITDVQQFNSNSSLNTQYFNAIASDGGYSDASYIRLKNISLYWQLPEVWWKKAHLKNCRIYFQGQNLITIANYKGLDPETQSTTTLPPLRVLTVGFHVIL